MKSRTALVTGASTGLGAEFARQLATHGHDLVLVARSADRLEKLAADLRATSGVRVDVVVQDLTEPDAAASIVDALTALNLQVDLLVNNAGFGTAGRFEDIPEGRDEDQLMINLVALVGLTRALVPGMLARGQGSIINVASTGAFQPSPFFATYCAGKTFVLNFSLALRSEYRGRGVKVLALCPGPTRTEFFDVVGERAAVGRFMTAEPVVRAALRGLDRDRAYVVPGLSNKVSAHLLPRRPRRMITAIAKLVTRSAAEAPAPPQPLGRRAAQRHAA
ncbi:SDR family oxidoreductase [Micromonospora sp. KC207]|uniref:SDR family NAD(P)-dependent oxidoreductase n=1 Tax=Micromonospora sp. KC207 TaxID=2530377 RepID=UPI0010540A5E|nr:SDR family oxidoreductase [Micromonospora sp. KC207]TDC65807.1 SDR family oxidoreductase [Micromonospora sp. KC207]